MRNSVEDILRILSRMSKKDIEDMINRGYVWKKPYSKASSFINNGTMYWYSHDEITMEFD